jgi:chromosome segregation ATPase
MEKTNAYPWGLAVHLSQESEKPSDNTSIEYYITRCEQLVTENESLNNRIAELEEHASNPSENKDDYMKAIRKITELKIQIEQLEKDRSALSVKANERIANLEEISGEHLKSARKNWDAYSMETDKTEKLSAENSELKSHLEKHGKRINELELEIVKNEAEWEEKTEKLQATLNGLLNLTDNESSEGYWRVTLDYDNYHDGARVLNGDGIIIGACYDQDKETNEQFQEAIDMAIRYRSYPDLKAI